MVVQDSLADQRFSNSRLTANRILRMKKIASYVGDKLDLLQMRKSRTGSIFGEGRDSREMSRNPSSTNVSNLPNQNSSSVSSQLNQLGNNGFPLLAEEILELSCRGRVLSPHQTLGAVKHFIFRQGGDVVINYRLRFPHTTM
jgi:WD repeat-containing protein 48